MILEIRIVLRAVVPREFEDAFERASIDVVVGAEDVAEEIEVEFRRGRFAGAEERHAEDVLIEVQGCGVVLDAEHGVVHPVRRRVRLFDVFGIFGFVVGYNLHPVVVRVEGERYMVHAAIGEFLLELVAGVLDALAGGLDVIDGDADVSEATAGVGVAVGYGVIGVVFGAVVVGEFDDALAVGPVGLVGEGVGGVVGEEIEVEFRLGLGDLLDEGHA